MKLILKIKPNKHVKKNRLIAWIQKSSELEEDMLQIFQIFKDDIKISKLSKIFRYYIVSSENPAIILNIFSTIQDILPEVYFNNDDSMEIEDFIDE
jgi:hypothetical protein